MEGLAPPLQCLIEIHAALQNAETIKVGLARYLQRAPVSDAFASEVRRFLFAWDQGQDWKAIIAGVRSSHRRALLDIMATALRGQSVLPHLEELRSEIVDAADSEIRRHLELLPVKMLVPLLFFQFPAFLLLLFGPLLSRLVEELSK